jgi:hypothetical protein
MNSLKRRLKTLKQCSLLPAIRCAFVGPVDGEATRMEIKRLFGIDKAEGEVDECFEWKVGD